MFIEKRHRRNILWTEGQYYPTSLQHICYNPYHIQNVHVEWRGYCMYSMFSLLRDMGTQ